MSSKDIYRDSETSPETENTPSPEMEGKLDELANLLLGVEGLDVTEGLVTAEMEERMGTLTKALGMIEESDLGRRIFRNPAVTRLMARWSPSKRDH